MYITPVLHPQTSNREDFLTTVSIFDDDTNQPLNLSGTTLAPGNPNGFTGNAWTVTDGGISTTSVTSLTIPGYPIGNQLTAVTLTVGTSLAIAAGDPIKIADTATGLNTMAGYVTSYSTTTGQLVCQIGLTFQFEIRRGGPRNTGMGYIPWYDWGTPDDLGPLIRATLGSGVTIVDIGYIQIRIPETQMRSLGNAGTDTQPGGNTGTMQTFLTLTDSVDTRQGFIGRLPVLWGGVTN